MYHEEGASAWPKVQRRGTGGRPPPRAPPTATRPTSCPSQTQSDTPALNTPQGAGVNPTVLILMVGVLLSGYSTFLSFGYLSKSKKEGMGALDGWTMLNSFYEHMT